MPTLIDYALMAGASYRSTRPDPNKFPIPQGWNQVSYSPPVASGFEAATFGNGIDIAHSTEVVISFAGTYDNPLNPFINPDFQADIGLATGFGSAQLLQAARYYLDVKASVPAGSTITLTGHSLGGGLAALISVFFHVSATAFDQAPFANSAQADSLLSNPLNGLAPDVAAELKISLLAAGYADVELEPLTNFLLIRPSDGTIPNSNLINNIRVAGEFLSVFPVGMYDTIGNNAVKVLQHAPTSASGTDLHAQSLLTAFVQSDATAAVAASGQKQSLSQVTFKLIDFLGMIFDGNLYLYRTDDSNHVNLLEHLIRHEAGNAPLPGGGAVAADAMVTRFTADLWKLAQDGGLTMSENFSYANWNNVSKALIAFAMQKYYGENNPNVTYGAELFTDLIKTGVGSNGIQFDTAAVVGNGNSITSAKGYIQYFQAYLDTTGQLFPEERILIKSILPILRDWYVQAGVSGMNATDALNRGAFMLGGSGADALVGGTAVDLLVGNAGNDLLQGGQGNDTLLGGLGNDAYVYNTGDGLDTLLDTSGQNTLAMDGVVLGGGKQYGDSRVHRSADGKHLYVQTDSKTLLIDGNIVIQNYGTGGTFGLTLLTTPVADPISTLTLVGDLVPIDQDTAAAGVQLGYDSLSNVKTDPNTPEPGRADALYGSSGNDIIEGRAGSDILDGWTGDDRLYADSQISTAAAIANGNILNSGSGLKGDWLAGGTGDDTLVGSYGNDVLTGGDGTDLLIGGAGNDDILGDIDWVANSFDWTVTDQPDGTRYFYPTNNYPATSGAADVIYAGEGADHAWGEFGNDVIFGEGGADKLYGEEGNDIILGGAGVDILYGDGGSATAQTSGNDYLDGGDETDYLYGGAGDDILMGGTGDDFIYTGSGKDVILYNAGDGKDTMDRSSALPGEAGVVRFGTGISASQIRLGLGSLKLDLGNGDEIHIQNFDRNDVFNSSCIGSFEFDDGTVLSTAELLARGFDLDGTAGVDYITGTNTTDRINGLGGNDFLDGDDGDDTLNGGAGNDYLNGGRGNDVYLFNQGDGQDTIYDLDSTVGNIDTIRFGTGIAAGDISFAFSGANLILGINSLSGSGQALFDQITIQNWRGGSESHIERVEFADGAVWDAAYLQAQLPITGTNGDDYLSGDAGNNTLDGAAGNDTLMGGAGDDIYLFNLGSGQDTIYEQDSTAGNIDTISFGAGIAASDITFAFSGANLILGINSSPGSGQALLDQVTIQSWGAGSASHIERVKFADGTVWDTTYLQAKISAIPIAEGWNYSADGSSRSYHAIDGLGNNTTMYYVFSSDHGSYILANQSWLNSDGSYGSYIFNVDGSGSSSIHNADGSYCTFTSDGHGKYNSLNYDANGNLTSTNQEESYFDASGNRTRSSDSESYYDAHGVLTGSNIGEYHYAYDANGNLASMHSITANYDANGNLTNSYTSTDHFGVDGGMVSSSWQSSDGSYGSDTYNADGSSSGTACNADSSYSSYIYDGLGNLTTNFFGASGSAFGFIVTLLGTLGHANAISTTVYDANGIVLGVATGDMVEQVIPIGASAIQFVSGISSADLAVSQDSQGNFLISHNNGSGALDIPAQSSVISPVVASFADGTSWQFVNAAGNAYDYTAGSGVTYLINPSAVQFGVGITSSMVTLGLGSLMLRVGNNGDLLHIEGFNPADALNSGALQSFTFADGTTLSYNDLLARGFDIYGTSGDEILTGTNLNNRIYGGSGNDTLIGGSSNDTLVGDSGNDILIGGSGNDTCVFNLGDGADVILNSAISSAGAEINTLVLGTGITADMITPVVSAAGEVTLEFGNGDSVRINRVGDLSIQMIQLADGSVIASESLLNAPPVAVADAEVASEDSVQASVTVASLLSNDTDPDIGDVLSITGFDAMTVQGNVVSMDAAGNLVFDIGNRYQYLAQGQSVTDIFNYTIADAAGATSTAQISMTIVGWNDAPVAVADTAVVQEDLCVIATGNVLFNDSDVDSGDVLVVANAGVFAGNYGQFTLAADGSYRYALDNTLSSVQSLATGQFASETFVYQASDGLISTPSSLTISIAGSNDTPAVVIPLAALSAPEEQSFSFSVPGNTFADVDQGDRLIYSASLTDGSALPRWLTFDVATGTFSGVPSNTDVGDLNIQVTATDVSGLSASSTFVLNIINVNDAPKVTYLLADQTFKQGQFINVVMPANAFNDVDFIHGDVFSCSATMADGSVLPAWIEFNAATRTFSGLMGDVGKWDLRVTATDLAGASVSDVFTLNVEYLATPGQRIHGTDDKNTLIGTLGDDHIGGEEGRGTMKGGMGNDTYVVNKASHKVVENTWSGMDTVLSSVNYTLGSNVEYLTLTGYAAINGIGNSLNNLIKGNAASNLLNGMGGNDILQGDGGNDTLTDDSGNNLFDGRSGADILSGGAGNDCFAGGGGNDSISVGNGADIIVFNRGDGQDVLKGGVGTDNTISLGCGIQYDDLALSKTDNDLILEVGRREQIKLKGWYKTDANYKSVLTLQVMADAMASFDPNSPDPLLNKAVQNFNFNAIVNAFDQASGANTTFMHWSATSSLLAAHLASSDTEALGGDLVRQYGMTGTFSGMNLSAAQNGFNAVQFGNQVQALAPLQGLQGGAVTL